MSTTTPISQTHFSPIRIIRDIAQIVPNFSIHKTEVFVAQCAPDLETSICSLDSRSVVGSRTLATLLGDPGSGLLGILVVLEEGAAGLLTCILDRIFQKQSLGVGDEVNVQACFRKYGHAGWRAD